MSAFYFVVAEVEDELSDHLRRNGPMGFEDGSILSKDLFKHRIRVLAFEYDGLKHLFLQFLFVEVFTVNEFLKRVLLAFFHGHVLLKHNDLWLGGLVLVLVLHEGSVYPEMRAFGLCQVFKESLFV